MRKLYENVHIFHFQKRIFSAETIRGNTVSLFVQLQFDSLLFSSALQVFFFKIDYEN